MSDNQQQYEDRKLALGNTKSMAELIRDNSRLSSSLAMMTAFVNELLDPEMYGHAVSMEVRDDARELLGMPRVETGESKRCGERRDALATKTATLETLRLSQIAGTEAMDEFIQKLHDDAKEKGIDPDHDERIIGACHARGVYFEAFMRPVGDAILEGEKQS